MHERWFSPEERNSVCNMLVHIAETHRNILGTILVGSGSRGFTDGFSDIDIIYVIDDLAYNEASQQIHAFIQDLRPIFHTSYQHRDDVVVQCLLLDNYLEIDIGIWSITSLFAVKPNWRLIQQHDNKSANTIRTALQTHSPAARPYKPVISGDNQLWQSIYGDFIAQKRNTAKNMKIHVQSKDRNLATKNLGQLYTPRQIKLLKPLLKSV